MTENPSCFNAVLRRILCSGNVPTHPSLESTPDHSTQKPHKTDTCPNHDNKPKSQPLAHSPSIKPGIVARLMGLDSLPESNWVRNPDSSFNRSKSVSFADYLMGFDDDHVASEATPASLHRRVKTSVSFREAPAVLSHHQNEGHEFLVVYLDENIKKKTEEVKQKSKKEEVFKKKEEKLVKKSVSGAQSSRVKKVVSKKGGENLREGSGEHAPLKKRKKKVEINPKLNKKHQNEAKRRETVYNTNEDSSPVSVFDIDDILVQHETWLSEYNSSPKDMKSVMKSPPRASYNEDPVMRAVKFKDMESVKSQESEDYTELLASRILKFTEEELRETKWVSNNEVKIEMVEEICVEVEAVILEVLLNQVIDDLVQLS